MTDAVEGQMNFADLDSWFGKTYPEPSLPTKEETSRQSSRKSSGSQSQTLPMCLCLRSGQNRDVSTMNWEDGPLLGEYTMLSFGESPREENASLLSQILEDSAHPKFYLSAKACTGILRRAENRGKTLPEELRLALEAQANA